MLIQVDVTLKWKGKTFKISAILYISLINRAELEAHVKFWNTEVILRVTTDRVLSQEKYVLKKQGSFPSMTL